MDKLQNFIRAAVKETKAKKEQLLKTLNRYLPNLDLSKRGDIRKEKELRDLLKFIVTGEYNIEILTHQLEEPDFIIKFEEELYGLEHTEVIETKKKMQFEFNQSIIKKIEEKFIAKYGNIGMYINISFKSDFIKINPQIKRKMLKEISSINVAKNLIGDSDFLFQLVYPHHLTMQDVDSFSDKIVEKIYDAFNN